MMTMRKGERRRSIRTYSIAAFLQVTGLTFLSGKSSWCAAALEPPRVTLEELVREALENNPAVQAARRAADARRAMISAARTLPDPTLGFQTMGNLIPPTLQPGDPSSARSLSVEQEIPFPGKLSLRGKIASKEADAESWNYEQTRRQVVTDLKEAYFELYFIHKSVEILEKDKDLLQSFADIAEAKYRVGEGVQQDVLKAHAEISRLLDELTVLEQRRGIVEARLVSLLYRPPGTPVGRPVELKKADFPYTLEELEQKAQSEFPMLQMVARQVERDQYGVELARREFYPDFSVGFNYVNRREMPEMYGLMLNVKLPLYYRSKQRPELESATLSLASSEKQRDHTDSWLSYQLREAYLTAVTSKRLVDLYETGVIRQATLSLESALAGYQVGAVDSLAVIDNVTTLLDYELRYYEAMADTQKALARLELLTGLELTQ